MGCSSSQLCLQQQPSKKTYALESSRFLWEPWWPDGEWRVTYWFRPPPWIAEGLTPDPHSKCVTVARCLPGLPTATCWGSELRHRSWSDLLGALWRWEYNVSDLKTGSYCGTPSPCSSTPSRSTCKRLGRQRTRICRRFRWRLHLSKGSSWLSDQ